ncbi:prefoldin subunit beta [Ferroglobus sp.]|uniref:prefoldin subunit beta n=1 Tax=Ferroglobus sp. TaxID=2614230 RepID=UPI0025C63DC3|nr:prefoldin subunit beta [Ferroglobus sp.]
MSEIPPAVQNLVAQLQQLQQQLQAVITQKAQLEAMIREIDDALKEMEKSQSEEVYKAVGSILVKVRKEDAEKELKERKETYEVRIKTLERQEEKLRERVAETQKKLQSMLSPQAG